VIGRGKRGNRYRIVRRDTERSGEGSSGAAGCVRRRKRAALGSATAHCYPVDPRVGNVITHRGRDGSGATYCKRGRWGLTDSYGNKGRRRRPLGSCRICRATYYCEKRGKTKHKREKCAAAMTPEGLFYWFSSRFKIFFDCGNASKRRQICFAPIHRTCHHFEPFPIDHNHARGELSHPAGGDRYTPSGINGYPPLISRAGRRDSRRIPNHT
jgi:hypothetical protein